MGLGLAISREIVELMGGSLSVASRVGEGSVFGFGIDLPVASAPGPIDERNIAPRVEAARILVAEDNPVNQRVVVRMLEKMGCDVDIASNGSEAVQLARTRSYDLIFMDCQMPELSGFEATREIRRTEDPRKRVSIVALTANALKEDRERCLAAGMDEYMTKPIRREILAGMLNRFVAEAPSSSDV